MAIILCSVSTFAQDIDKYHEYLASFKKYKQESSEEFETYREKINAEYAEYMRQAWSQYNIHAATPIPQRPEPPTPVVKDPQDTPLNEARPLEIDIPKSIPISTPKPSIVSTPQAQQERKPVVVPKVRCKNQYFTFDFYGTPCKINADESYRITLNEVSNDAIADAWESMSSQKYYDLVDELLELKEDLQLCDWGYVQLTDKFSSTLMSNKNEARILQIFLLSQSGYKLRIAQCNGRVLLLMPFADNTTVYNYSYINREGIHYYILDKNNTGSISVFDRDFPNGRFCSLEIKNTPLLKSNLDKERRLQSKRYDDVKARYTINKNIIDFYNEYPITSKWDMYVRTSISSNLSEVLYSQLRTAIASKSVTEAANMLLNFVQTAFDYQVDGTQFGYERPLFGDETLYYPYCDCEDRAILYAILVRELLGLDVILLNYPEHIATAVCFGSDIAGRYIDYDGKRYFVCDPTYIGASIGDAMPQLRNEKAVIVEI